MKVFSWLWFLLVVINDTWLHVLCGGARNGSVMIRMLLVLLFRFMIVLAVVLMMCMRNVVL